jgi:hypothetical protein
MPERPAITDAPDGKLSERRTAIDRAGVDYVLEREQAEGREPHEMPHHHKGYDVESSGLGDQLRYIEVKSLSGRWTEWDAAALTAPEFETACELRERYWLYVVESAETAERCLYRIQDPARKINQYLFDDGWKALAETDLPGLDASET